MCEECAPSVPVTILLGLSGSVDYFGCVYDTDSDNSQEVISLGSGLMWNDADVYGGRIVLEMFVRDLSDRWKSLDIESVMI